MERRVPESLESCASQGLVVDLTKQSRSRCSKVRRYPQDYAANSILKASDRLGRYHGKSKLEGIIS